MLPAVPIIIIPSTRIPSCGCGDKETCRENAAALIFLYSGILIFLFVVLYIVNKYWP